jgi:hypothetical protein
MEIGIQRHPSALTSNKSEAFKPSNNIHVYGDL